MIAGFRSLSLSWAVQGGRRLPLRRIVEGVLILLLLVPLLLLLLPLLLLPALASASDCKHEDIRQLALDLDGISQVRFEVTSHDLRVDGVAADAAAPLRIRACASDADYLPQLVVESSRRGDTLVGNSSTVERRTLTPLILVRIQVPQPASFIR